MKPRLLDLFCGAGGAAMGYSRAGFDVIGVDIQPQPHYPFEFIKGDALEVLAGNDPDVSCGGFDAIHASPPCQAYTSMNRRWVNQAPRMIAETRRWLNAPRLPYVIENVGGAVSELREPTRLCGRSLGLAIHRHRLFETTFPVMASPCTGSEDPFGIYGKLDGRRLRTRTDGSELRAARTLEEAQEAMGIDWMEWDELREAIPPVMTEHLGGFLLTEVERRSKVAA